MDDWEFEDEWLWEDEAYAYEDLLFEWAEEFADTFFLSDNRFLPSAEEAYHLGFLDFEDWWSLVQQLDTLVDLEGVIGQLETFDTLLRLDGLPIELLEDPLTFLESVLEGGLPLEPSGRRVDSRRLVKIALEVVRLLRNFPEPAQAAVQAWANVHRRFLVPHHRSDDDYGDWDLADLLFDVDLPPAMTGFSMMIALTLMRWPERAEGLPLPPGFGEVEVHDEVLAEWEELPDSPNVTEEGVGEAEALFAQGQLAHTLAQMGAVELMAMEEVAEADLALAYSRLSRAILWVHNQCRHCPEREGVTCRVADNWPEQPVPLLDIAGEIANTGRVGGCIKMDNE